MTALAEALVAAQAELPTAVVKDSTGQIGQRTYSYLSLDKLIAETRPILQKHGLAIVQEPTFVTMDDGLRPTVTTRLLHVDGEELHSVTPLYVQDKTMQGLGSAITYARRYAWQSILGIAAEDDNDAADEIPF